MDSLIDRFPNPVSLTREAATLADAMGIEPPREADPPILPLAELLKEKMGGTAERTLFFHPDAAAEWLFRKYPDYFLPVLRHAPMTRPYSTVMPSVTPVCFATIYSGALPEKHGIRAYQKPILTIDTLFDRLLDAGKRVANVASRGCSMAMIFADRKMDAYVTEDDGDTFRTALSLLEEDKYDHVSVYFGEYDSIMHARGTESAEALAKLEEHFRHFGLLAEKARTLWAGKRHLIAVGTDHGVHDQADGRGAHGTDLTADLNVLHFYGAYKN
ncbi:MAG: hypothetical protein J5849_00240 [Clostridia bacterium]|nr:hypothetical protein [Clostridia bacterium]